jgi:hypothetical protein
MTIRPLRILSLITREGAELLQFCQKELGDAQREVSVVEAGMLKKFEGLDDS